MNIRLSLQVKTACLVLLVLSLCPLAHSEEAATLYSAQGLVEGIIAPDTKWQKLSKGDKLKLKDQIRTGANSRAGLKFVGGKLLRLRENSLLEIQAPQGQKKRQGRLSLFSGVAYLFSRKSDEFPVVETPEVSAAIRGTELVVEVKEDQTTVSVLDGNVELSNDAGTLVLNKGEQGITKLGQAPTKAILVNPLDAVQWALYYPALIDINDYASVFKNQSSPAYLALKNKDWGLAWNSFQGKGFEGVFARALILYKKGNAQKASELLNSAKKSSLPAVKLFKSALYLSLGKVETAASLLEGVKEETDSSILANYYAQKAVIAIAKNKKDAALNFAEQALSASANSVSALIAKAYVHQSRFELIEAKSYILKAQALDPNNDFALARLAELELAFGNLDTSVVEAKKAVLQNPNNAYAQAVLGYAHLTRYEVDKANTYFNKAIALDDGSGLAFLGLGLAKIRAGELEAGRAEIEKAVHLEPNVALYRSYLGKAFFEEENEQLAAAEYEHAISLDPNDPTPHLYKAFNSLSQNKPVEALENVEDSISRNNNRAVYRSNFLLDQDLAVRGTSLSEVFNQLGFSRVSQLEAMKSINRDYGNYSAHRLLADSYDGDFFSDAQFTENAIADVLAPVSFNVFQSQNGFSGAAGLNEYSALFDRPEHRTGILSSVSNQDDEVIGSVFQTGKVDNFGYYTGYRTLYGRGRKNGGDYAREHRFDLATQYQIDYENRVSLQTAYTRTEDIMEFDGDEFDDFEVALASHHIINAHSQFLTRFEYFDRSYDTYELNIPRVVAENLIIDNIERPLSTESFSINEYNEEDTRSFRYSAQYIYDSSLVSLVGGAQILDSRGDANEESPILDDPSGIFLYPQSSLRSSADYETLSYSGYLYSTWHLAPWVDANLGLNYTEIEMPAFDVIAPYISGERDEQKLSPKVGLTLYPTPETSIRAAYFQSLGISNISDIGSIEPTIVGSFSQLFNDLPGAKTETFGIGIDHKCPKKAYMGIEYMYRDIERDAITVSDILSINLDNLTESQSFSSAQSTEKEREHILRSYFYYVLNKQATTTLDYSRLVFEGEDENETDRIAAGLNYFYTSRFFSFTRAAWYQQDLKDVFGFEDGEEDFWLLDAGLGYRIKKRHGSLRLVFNNLLDEDFTYDDRGRLATIHPDFNVGLEVSVNF